VGAATPAHAAQLASNALERALAEGAPAIPDQVRLRFCQTDSRFANVIARPDGRIGLVDWEASGLRDPARQLADLLTHPNQEDLLDATGWQPFLDHYFHDDAEADLHNRLRGYLILFGAFWLGLLLGTGMQRIADGTFHKWTVNGLEPNLRLRRYLARCHAWPSPDPSVALAALDGLEFF
jgi:thiamine kinase-like enzyme